MKNLEFFSLFFKLHYSTYLFFCCLNYKFQSRDLQESHQEQGREESQQQGNSISQVPDINQAPLRKKQLEEELDQPRKRSRGFGMGM